MKFELAINCARFLLPPSQCWERGQGGEGLSLPTTYTLQTTTYALLPQVWYLTADIGCWAGLMPHVHGVEVLDRRGGRTLARVAARRGWLPVRLTCGFERADERHVMHRWYRGRLWRGIVETWRVAERDDGYVELRVTLQARGLLARALTRLVILPLARRQLEMIDLLATAHRRAREASWPE